MASRLRTSQTGFPRRAQRTLPGARLRTPPGRVVCPSAWEAEATASRTPPRIPAATGTPHVQSPPRMEARQGLLTGPVSDAEATLAEPAWLRRRATATRPL